MFTSRGTPLFIIDSQRLLADTEKKSRPSLFFFELIFLSPNETADTNMSRLSIALCIAALVVVASAAITTGRHFPEAVSVDRSAGWSPYVSKP